MLQDNKNHVIYCLLLMIMCFALYGNTIHNDYVLDDGMVLKDNLFVRNGIRGLNEIFSTPRSGGTEINNVNEFYRPLSMAMFALEVELFGLNPAIGHFMNIVVFVGCVLLLFVFIRKLTDSNTIAFTTAFLFTIHPVHTEVVANIKSRDELLCYFLGMWSLILFVYYREEGKSVHLAGGIITMFLAFLAKETVVTFVILVPMLFLLFPGQKRRALMVTSSMIGVSLAYLWIRHMILGKTEMDAEKISFIENSLVAVPDSANELATKFIVLGRYLKLLFLPHPLLCNYSFNNIPFSNWNDINVWLSLGAYIFLILFCLYAILKRKWKVVTFGVMFYIITLALFSNILFLIGAQMAERFLFFASTGFCIVFGWALVRLLRAEDERVPLWKNMKSGGVLLLLGLMYGGATFARNLDWKNNLSLYSADLKKSPNDARLYYWLAAELAQNQFAKEQDPTKKKDLDKKSLNLLHNAIRIYPNFADAMAEIGWLHQRNNEKDSAYLFNNNALRLEPNNIEANSNMGNLYYSLGKYDKAIPFLKNAIAGNPSLKMAQLALANCYMQMKQYDYAINSASRVVDLDPEYADAHEILGNAYMNKQNLSAAEDHYKIVIKSKPSYIQAINNLGVIYLNTRRYQEAIRQFEHVLSTDIIYNNAYSNLSRAYFLTGRYEDAITTINKKMKIDSNISEDIPILALSYFRTGKIDLAQKFATISQQRYPNFKLE